MTTLATLLEPSVVVIAEIRMGLEDIRRGDPASANCIEAWLNVVVVGFNQRILPITLEIAQRYGVIAAQTTVAPVDGLLAATAIEHQLVVVTRNEKHFKPIGVQTLNPFT